VIAEPHTTLTELTSDDTWLIVCSDGLLANEERGGGSGLRCGGQPARGGGQRSRLLLRAAWTALFPALRPCCCGRCYSAQAMHAAYHARLPVVCCAACSNEDAVATCNRMAGQPCDKIAAELAQQAVDMGSTDDVTVLVVKLK
jgi:hypothetical protein